MKEKKKKTNMVVKGISMDNYTSEEPMNCLGRFSNTFASEGSPVLIPKFGSVFSRTRSFVLKMVFSHTWLRKV